MDIFYSDQNRVLCLQGSIYSLFLYDAVYLYMTMMDQIVSEGLDWRNGTFWRTRARNWITYGQSVVMSFSHKCVKLGLIGILTTVVQVWVFFAAIVL